MKSLGIRKLGLGLLLCLALSFPLFGTGTEFLDNLETELNSLESLWEKSLILQQEQKKDYQKLLEKSQGLETSLVQLQAQLQTLQKEQSELTISTSRLKSISATLETSLREKEAEMQSLKTNNWFLKAGIIGTIALSLASIIYTSIR